MSLLHPLLMHWKELDRAILYRHSYLLLWLRGWANWWWDQRKLAWLRFWAWGWRADYFSPLVCGYFLLFGDASLELIGVWAVLSCSGMFLGMRVNLGKSLLEGLRVEDGELEDARLASYQWFILVCQLAQTQIQIVLGPSDREVLRGG